MTTPVTPDLIGGLCPYPVTPDLIGGLCPYPVTPDLIGGLWIRGQWLPGQAGYDKRGRV